MTRIPELDDRALDALLAALPAHDVAEPRNASIRARCRARLAAGTPGAAADAQRPPRLRGALEASFACGLGALYLLAALERASLLLAR